MSTNSSLIQHWWSQSGFPGGSDPYWLYGASNLGSLLALLSYPFVVEPALGLAGQARWWTVGYGTFAALTLLALWRAGRTTGGSGPAAAAPGDADPAAAPVPVRRKLLWVARAAVGSSLLLSFTMQITTDLAPVPLLWVVPLALYLVTFILAFSFTDRLPRAAIAGGTVVSLSAALGILLVQGRYPFEILLGVSLAALFMGALLCHRDLAADRPPARQLTSFYLWISFGGALGGVMNSLVSPLLFDSVAELPLTLAALALLLHFDPERGGALSAYRPSWRIGVLAAVGFAVPLFVALRHADSGPGTVGLVIGFAALWGLATARYVGLFALSAGLACGLVLLGVTESNVTIDQDRSFFGVVRIRDFPDAVEMIHGTTLHGRQLHDPAYRRTPITYYYPDGPLATLVSGAPEGGSIGIIGLGTGALAATARAGHRMVFFEIDPVVDRMAREHFTYLEDSPADVSVVLGDGRLALEELADGSLDVLLVDAFSSDFVPMHLLTEEALDLYLRKVRAGGVLALHISNRHADLRRVLRGYGETAGRGIVFSDYSPGREARALGAVRTVVGALAPDPATLEAMAATPLWTRFRADVAAVHWTDDHADLLSVLR